MESVIACAVIINRALCVYHDFRLYFWFLMGDFMVCFSKTCGKFFAKVSCFDARTSHGIFVPSVLVVLQYYIE